MNVVPEVKSSEPSIVGAIAQVRQDWEAASEGESLTNIDGNVGLILVDVVKALGLNPDETVKALGGQLYRDVLPYLLIPVA